MNTLRISIPGKEYNVTIGTGILSSAGQYFNLNRKVFILTDSGVPKSYAEAVKSQAKDAMIYTIECGEASKNPKTLFDVLSAMLAFGMTRSDCAVAVGGGVVGDLTGFAAGVYMRGIDFYNVPTTLLAQVDSSIGGKTAVNLDGVKNIVGVFHQPSAVLIDTDVLSTLPKRHIAAGLAEALKMSLTSDSELFDFFEKNKITAENMEYVITRSLMIKKQVVEKDEKESGLRKILNFGHTLGHGIEAVESQNGLYHGECVALGMIPMSSDAIKERMIPILSRLGLQTTYEKDIDKALSFIEHDKKCKGNSLDVIFVDEPGSYRIEKLTVNEFKKIVKERF